MTRQELAEIRKFAITEMWRDGFTMAEIAGELGTSPGTVQVEIANLRGMGYALPYRTVRVDRVGAA